MIYHLACEKSTVKTLALKQLTFNYILELDKIEKIGEIEIRGKELLRQDIELSRPNQ